MLKEIKKESDVITNQDLFHEIIEKVKESEIMSRQTIMKQDFMIMSFVLYSLCSQAAMKGIILIFISEVIIV